MALRVLLADESSAIKKVFELALQDYGVQIKTVHRGTEVMEAASSFQPDIMFADILLQKQSGYDVAKLVRESNLPLKSLPIVLMWSGFIDFDEKRFSESKANAKLEKPFDVESLRRLVQQLVPKTQTQPLSAFLDFPKLQFEESLPKSPETSDTGPEGLVDSHQVLPPIPSPLDESDEGQDLPPAAELPALPTEDHPEGLFSLPEMPLELDLESSFDLLRAPVLTGEKPLEKPNPSDKYTLFPPPIPEEGDEEDDSEGAEAKIDEKKRGEWGQQWDMDSFQKIEEFAAEKLSESPQEEFAQIPLASLKKLTNAGAKPTQPPKRSLNLGPTRSTSGQELIPSLDDPNEGADGIEIPLSEESPRSDEEWAIKDLSKFKIDLPPGAEDDEAEDSFISSAVESAAPLPTLSPAPSPTLSREESFLKSEKSMESLAEAAPTSLPIPNREEIMELVREQCRAIIESVVWKVVPEMAQSMVKEELDRLLREEETPRSTP